MVARREPGRGTSPKWAWLVKLGEAGDGPGLGASLCVDSATDARRTIRPVAVALHIVLQDVPHPPYVGLSIL